MMGRAICLAALMCSTATTALSAARAAAESADVRAERTLRQMTPEERRGLLLGYIPFLLPAAERPKAMGAGYVPGVARLGVPALLESDASLGVANMGAVLRGPRDTATALPSSAAMAAGWDAGLAERAGAMIGAEARQKGFNVLLGGGVNLTREPRNGRNFEYLGEDPLLAGVLAGHAIRGVQSNHIISTIKHYALNAQETGRTVLTANIGEAALRESDLLAFEIALEIGKPGSVMCAYNQVNGVYACENSFLLNDVLRRDWGYKGFVMSDWGAVHSTSLRQGLDQESGTNPKQEAWFGPKLKAALDAGSVSQADADRAAARILRTIYSTGVADHPVQPGEPADLEAHAKVAQEVAENGIVLLKNDGDLLPVAATARRILVVGAHADVGVPGGGGSSQVNPIGGPALSLGIPGKPVYARKLYAKSSPLEALRARLPGAQITYDDGTDPQRAAAAARSADLVVVFAEQFATEGADAPDLSLPDNQDGLIAAVADANPRTAVVLETGGPVLMPWLGWVGAVLEAWYPGQRGGEAIARVLTGEVDAAGRLPITFPASIDQTPNPHLPGSELITDKGEQSLYDLPEARRHFAVTYPEGSDVGYRGYERRGARPLFAFGHGLSYTRFDYGDLQLAGGRTLQASFRITNVGPRPGIETAQLYARVNGVRRLVGWARVDLKPGEARRVTVTADPRLLASFDVTGHGWRVAEGLYEVDAAAASDAPRLTGKVRLAAQRLRP